MCCQIRFQLKSDHDVVIIGFSTDLKCPAKFWATKRVVDRNGDWFEFKSNNLIEE